ncbi:MAG: ferritin family protein [Deltaproteobacteria bacterium]|nr:ferritin family protein [Deltaproteobacteria bacterium]
MIYGFNAGEVFQMAIEIEENGKVFYDQAGQKITDPQVKALFAALAQEEVTHKAKFISLKDKLPADATGQTVYDPENEINQYLKMMADLNVFRTDKRVADQVAGIKGAADAVHLAMQFEKDSIVFFLTMQDSTEEPQGRQLIGQLVKEEQQHLKRLSIQLKKLGH